MNTPDHDPFAFDERLRAHHEAAAQTPPVPPARVWEGLQAKLYPAPVAAPVSRRAPLLAGAGGLVVGALLMWGSSTTKHDLPAVVNAPVAMVKTSDAMVGAPVAVVKTSDAVVNRPVAVVKTSDAVVRTFGAAVSAPVAVVDAPEPMVKTARAGSSAPEARPGPTVSALLRPLVQAETALAALGTDTVRATREHRRALLLTERAALATLTRRTDSLLRTLDGAALALTAPAPAAKSASDSAAPAPFRRFSVVLAFAPERNFFGLGAPATDTLSALRRTHEQGRAGYHASVGAEYRLDRRLSVGAGLGVASYGAELRLTEQRTTVSTQLDSAINTTSAGTTIITKAYIVRRVRDSVLVPILDFNNVVVGYQYEPTTRPDTVWTHLTSTVITNTTSTTYTPTVTTRQETSARILRPNYRFLTVPLLVRYRLGRATDWTGNSRAPRWWADVAVGAQLQWFLGGTQASTRDGLTYHTERVGPRGGPFRPFNLALTGAVAFNYALTPRLSASLAPTLRYQVESVYRASTNLTQRPTATGVQMGLKYAF